MKYIKFFTLIVCMFFALAPLHAQRVDPFNASTQTTKNSHALDDKLLTPDVLQNEKKAAGQSSQIRRLNAESSIDLGDGMFLLSPDIDPKSSVLEVKVSAAQWERLTSPSDFDVELRNISNLVYSKFNDDFDFILYVLNTSNGNISTQLGFYGINLGVSNNVQGIGSSIFNNTADWGSEGMLKRILLLLSSVYQYYKPILSIIVATNIKY